MTNSNTSPVIGQIFQQDPVIVERLAGYGIRTLADWRRLGRHRLQLFGVTHTLIKKLDALAASKGQP